MKVIHESEMKPNVARGAVRMASVEALSKELDANGVVLEVNEPWRRFGQDPDGRPVHRVVDLHQQQREALVVWIGGQQRSGGLFSLLVEPVIQAEGDILKAGNLNAAKSTKN